MPEAAAVDRNDLAFWFPRLEAARLPVPRTQIVRTDAVLIDLLDGHTPCGWGTLIYGLRDAGDRMGWPCFLRTGHGSGKHEWSKTCFVTCPADIERHVAALVEWSSLVDFFGLPTQTWAVRELIATVPLFRCTSFAGFPVTREFRVFTREGRVDHIQPYWPPEACEEGRPDAQDWRARLATASRFSRREAESFAALARGASQAMAGGDWSVDLLQDRRGKWWITDMAEADRSFRWEPSA